MNKEQMEVLEANFDRILRTKEIDLHIIDYMLQIALSGVSGKSDLSSEERLCVKSIRESIKGL